MAVTPAVRFLKDADGRRVAYSMFGEGPTVVIPPWWITHLEVDWEWPEIRTFLERLSQGLRIVRYDRPGMGMSDRDIPVGRRLEDEVDLLERVVAAAGVERPSIYAQSCAGPVAILYAQKHPVDKLCIYGSFADGDHVATKAVQSALLQTVAAHWGMGSRVLADVFLPDQPTETLEAFSRYQRSVCTSEMAQELLRLTYSLSVADAAQTIDRPTLILHRRNDRAVPLEAGKHLAGLMPNAAFASHEGTCHPPWVEGAEAVDAIRSFLLGRDAVEETVIAEDTSCGLDQRTRSLSVDGESTPLTKLEYAVMELLIVAEGRVVSRDELLENVWGTPFAGSNKVEAVIRTLRKKLGSYATSVKTVTGHGYRFAGWTKE